MNRPLWFLFPFIVALVFCWFAFKSIPPLFHYFILSRHAPAKVVDWEINEIGKNKYVLLAKFIFENSGEELKGNSKLDTVYPNPWAAELGLEKQRNREFTAWFSASHPERAVLDKKFPFKMVISTLTLLGLFFYFYLLGRVVERKKVGWK